MAFLLEHHWTIFIILEVSSMLFLIIFALIRYAFTNIRFSVVFLILFFVALMLEAILAYVIYRETGEITTFQIIIAIFLIYAVTFGISDFKRLDRYIKQKVGKWRGVDLLTDKEKEIIARLKDPKVIARRARMAFYIHTIIFIIGVAIFWIIAGNKDYSFTYFLMNLDWYNDVMTRPQPFNNDMIVNVVRLWILIYIIDSIVNWSYTIFLDKKED